MMMEWFNVFGMVFVIVILIPNIIFAIRSKGSAAPLRQKRWIEVMEQIGRFGCIAFMIFQIPGTWFGWWSDEAFAVYLVADAILALAYCAAWIVLWKKNNMVKAITLSVIPAVLFLFSGVMCRSILLLLSAVLFAPAHLWISCKNAGRDSEQSA